MVNNEIIKLKFDNSFNGRLFAVQGDTGRVFNLQVFDDFSKPVDVTGMKLRMYVANSKEVSYSEGEIVEAAEGKIKVQVYNSQLKYPGKQKAQFILTDKDGQKIGSKIFDLWIEEGLEAGPTVGRNIYVDFDKINEALDLIKDYDKTLEEAKEVDASLKVGITEGIEARNNLADCKKKALEIKGQLDNSKVSANKTLDDLNKTKAEFETLKSNLSSENQKATTNISTLSEKIEEGKTTTSELNKSIINAKTNKSNLDKSNTTALATKKLLEDATTAAKTTETDLSNLKNNGDTLYRNLSTKITEGSNLKSNLDRSVSNAANYKSNLDESIANATSTNTTLKVTNTEAKKTEALIKDLMSQLGKTENEVKQIIASGDLSKYVTDPKLQEVLKNYATKADLQGIDVTSQLADYAKKTDLDSKVDKVSGKDLSSNDYTNADKAKIDAIPENPKYTDTIPDLSGYAKKTDVKSSLSEMTSDSSHRTITDSERAKWNRVDNKVDKVSGKALSTNDYSNAHKAKVDAIPENPKYTDTIPDLSGYAKKSEINNKVDKDGGKVLSDNNYTNEDKTKVVSLPSNANWVVSIVNNFAGVKAYSNDLNNLTKAGIYSCRSNTNKPSLAGSYGTCIVTKADGTVGDSNTDTIQMWIDNNNKMYVRNNIDKSDGSWTDWAQIGGSDDGDIQTAQIDGIITFQKKNGVVYVSGTLSPSTFKSKIPYGFRPERDISINVANNNNQSCAIEFYSDGTIKDRINTYGSTYADVCFSYLTDN